MSHEQRAWCSVASVDGGSFVSTFAKACLYADHENFELLENVLAELMKKYPSYLTRLKGKEL